MLAEFDTPTELVNAAKAAYAEGYREMDAYSPFPIEEASEAIGFHKTAVPLIVLMGGILGGLSGFGLQYWINVIAYPLNIGGKPYDSWPAFIVPTFEMTILFAGLSGVFGMFALNGLPRPYHPLFQRGPVLGGDARQVLPVRGGRRSASSIWWERSEFMERLKPLSISEVPH